MEDKKLQDIIKDAFAKAEELNKDIKPKVPLNGDMKEEKNKPTSDKGKVDEMPKPDPNSSVEDSATKTAEEPKKEVAKSAPAKEEAKEESAKEEVAEPTAKSIAEPVAIKAVSVDHTKEIIKSINDGFAELKKSIESNKEINKSIPYTVAVGIQAVVKSALDEYAKKSAVEDVAAKSSDKEEDKEDAEKAVITEKNHTDIDVSKDAKEKEDSDDEEKAVITEKNHTDIDVSKDAKKDSDGDKDSDDEEDKSAKKDCDKEDMKEDTKKSAIPEGKSQQYTDPENKDDVKKSATAPEEVSKNIFAGITEDNLRDYVNSLVDNIEEIKKSIIDNYSKDVGGYSVAKLNSIKQDAQEAAVTKSINKYKDSYKQLVKAVEDINNK